MFLNRDDRMKLRKRSKWQRLFTNKLVLILFILPTICFIKTTQSSHGNKSKTKEKENDIQYFDLANKNIMMPSHMDLVDPSVAFKPTGFVSIDTAHRQGKIHIGSWIYVLDSSLNVEDPRLLILKREDHLITCPGTWSLVGEHAFQDEPVLKTVHRGIMEELGYETLRYISNHGKISNLTEFPVYYERDYGSSNGGRIDRQITYLWLVEMNVQQKLDVTGKKTAENLVDNLLQLDDEVADHKWIPLKEMSYELNRDSHDENNSINFCHHTIVSLTKLGLQRLIQIHDKRIKVSNYGQLN